MTAAGRRWRTCSQNIKPSIRVIVSHRRLVSAAKGVGAMRRFQVLVLGLAFCTGGGCGQSQNKTAKKSTDAAPAAETKKADPADEKNPPDQPAVVVKKDGESKPAVVITKDGPPEPAPSGAE